MIEYLVCAKFDEFFLFETEQFTSYNLISSNNAREELLEIAKKFFIYLLDLINKNNSITYFEKEELNLYVNLLNSSEEGIKETKKFANFFLRNKKKEADENIYKTHQDKNHFSNQSQNLDDSIIKSEGESKIFLKSKTFCDNILQNNQEDNDNDTDKNINVKDNSKNVENKMEEELKQIKTRIKFHTICHKNSNLNDKSKELNKSYDNDLINLELLKKNNDYLLNKCSEIITKIKNLNSNIITKKTHNSTKKNSLLNKLISNNNKSSNKKSLFLTSAQTHFASNTINTNESESIFNNLTYDPILPSVKTHKDYFNVFDWHDTEICKQMTLVTHFILERIKPKELINSQWTKVDKKTSAPNVYKLIERFNKISLWACEEILSYDKSSLRKLVLDKFVNIAHILFKMNNYNDAFSIVTALNSFFIKELKKSWKRVDANSSIPKAKELNEIFSHAKNYAKLREMLDSCLGMPCVPFLGLFLKDLSYMDESHKYIVSKQEQNIHLLNLEKIKNVDVVLKKFEQYQKVKYEFKPVFKLSFLAEPDPLSENLLIEFARKLGNFYILFF
jgi:hypothetical protein